MVVIEVNIGVIHSGKELSIETEQSAKALQDALQAAIAEKKELFWFEDRNGRSVGVPVDKLAYIEIGDENAQRRVGFGGV